MKYGFLFLMVFFSFFGARGQEAAPSFRMTLEECLDYAMGFNLNRQSVELSRESIEESYEQSKLERLPSVSASVSEGMTHNRGNSANWSGSYGLSTNVPVYQGGSIENTIDQNRLRVEQADYRTALYDNELTIQILQAFISVLGNEELLKYQRALLRASEEQLNQGTSQFSVGAILESDYLLLKAQYAQDYNNITDTEIARENGLLTLKGLLSMDPAYDLEIVAPDSSAVEYMTLLPPLDYVLGSAMATLPDLQISRYDVEIATKDVEVARSGFLPTVSLSGSIGTGHQNNFNRYGNQLSDRLNEQIGVSVSIPIFSRGQNRSRVTQNEIALRQAELSERQTEIDTRQTVIQEFNNVVSSHNNFQVSEELQYAYLKNFETSRVQYNVGAITVVDLLQQQNNYISALNNFIQNKYTFMLRRKILDVYMGEEIKM